MTLCASVRMRSGSATLLSRVRHVIGAEAHVAWRRQNFAGRSSGEDAGVHGLLRHGPRKDAVGPVGQRAVVRPAKLAAVARHRRSDRRARTSGGVGWRAPHDKDVGVVPAVAADRRVLQQISPHALRRVAMRRGSRRAASVAPAPRHRRHQHRDHHPNLPHPAIVSPVGRARNPARACIRVCF